MRFLRGRSHRPEPNASEEELAAKAGRGHDAKLGDPRGVASDRAAERAQRQRRDAEEAESIDVPDWVRDPATGSGAQQTGALAAYGTEVPTDAERQAEG